MLPPTLPPSAPKSDKPRIAVMLTAYKRTHLLPEQLKAVMGQTVPPSEVLIWDQSDSGVPPELQRHAIRLPRNLGVWPRFVTSLFLDADYIAVFDDDSIPGERFLENCLRCFDQLGPCLLGGNGVCFKDGQREQRAYFGWGNPQEQIVQVDIVGHAFVFPRELLLGWDFDPVGWETCGEDYYLAHQAQKRGWKTYVPPHPPNDKSWWSSLRGEAGTDDVAIYKQPGEAEKKAAFHEKLKAMGWQPSAVVFDDRGQPVVNAIPLASAHRCPHCGGVL